MIAIAASDFSDLELLYQALMLRLPLFFVSLGLNGALSHLTWDWRGKNEININGRVDNPTTID